MNRRDFKDIINNCPELCFAIKNGNFDRAKMLIRDLVSQKKITQEIINSVLYKDGKDEVVKFLLQEYIEQTKENNSAKNLETQNNNYSSSDYD
ncbi:MAG: hypothetical protein UR12_C0023G0016 [candidate division TM6 bacterium GW2011_GWF2_30_66]|nr:MAG: hypothetical protein UR12_C0023G0016 [candidate division TM6 bacterium GW2011_GWF2_30_66]